MRPTPAPRAARGFQLLVHDGKQVGLLDEVPAPFPVEIVQRVRRDERFFTHARSDRSVILEPLNPGATNLVFVDERSIAISNVRILVCSASAIPVKFEDGPDCE